jgi:hypothetical protein
MRQQPDTPNLAAAEHFMATTLPWTVKIRYVSPLQHRARIPPVSKRIASRTVPQGWSAAFIAAGAIALGAPGGAGPVFILAVDQTWRDYGQIPIDPGKSRRLRGIG